MALLLHELRSPLASIQNAIAILRIRSRGRVLAAATCTSSSSGRCAK